MLLVHHKYLSLRAINTLTGYTICSDSYIPNRNCRIASMYGETRATFSKSPPDTHGELLVLQRDRSDVSLSRYCNDMLIPCWY